MSRSSSDDQFSSPSRPPPSCVTAHCGGELLGLERRDIDPLHGAVSVVRQTHEVTGQGRILTPRSPSWRGLPKGIDGQQEKPFQVETTPFTMKPLSPASNPPKVPTYLFFVVE